MEEKFSENPYKKASESIHYMKIIPPRPNTNSVFHSYRKVMGQYKSIVEKEIKKTKEIIEFNSNSSQYNHKFTLIRKKIF